MSKILGDRESDLRYYLNDVAMTRFEPLSREREVALASRIKKGDLQARNELVQANLRFVISVAKNYQHRGLPFSDLISAGNLGLITAAERFDGAKGHKFISYAVWWIRQSILTTLSPSCAIHEKPHEATGMRIRGTGSRLRMPLFRGFGLARQLVSGKILLILLH